MLADLLDGHELDAPGALDLIDRPIVNAQPDRSLTESICARLPTTTVVITDRRLHL